MDSDPPSEASNPPGYDYAAYYKYYQQNPEAWAQYVSQWQQYQSANNPSNYYNYVCATNPMNPSQVPVSMHGYGASFQPQGNQSIHPHHGQQNPAHNMPQNQISSNPSNQSNLTSNIQINGPHGMSMNGRQSIPDHLPQSSHPSHYPRGDRNDRVMPSTTLWVGNLPWDCVEQDIRGVFEVYGRIRSIRMLNNKNCAFVTFFNMSSSAAAHNGTYNLTIKNTPVKVGWGKAPNNEYNTNSNHRNNSNPNGGPNQHQRDDYVQPSPNLWIGQLDPSVNEEELRIAFGQFGIIERIRLLPARNCAFINFRYLESSLEAKDRMNGVMIHDMPIRVNFGKQREERNQMTNNQDHQSNPSPWIDNINSNENTLSINQVISKVEGMVPPQPPQHDIQVVIDRLVDNMIEKGPELEQILREKQADNPRFAFLRGGVGSEYFTWKLAFSKNQKLESQVQGEVIGVQDQLLGEVSGVQNQLPGEVNGVQNQPQNQPQNQFQLETRIESQIEPQIEPQIELQLDWKQKLTSLDSSRESIESTASIFLENFKSHQTTIQSLFEQMIQQSSTIEEKMNLLFVVNEMLQSNADMTSDQEISQGLVKILVPMLSHLRIVISQKDMGYEIISKLIEMWQDRKLVNEEIMAQWQQDWPLSGDQINPNQSNTDGKARDREDSWDETIERAEIIEEVIKEADNNSTETHNLETDLGTEDITSLSATRKRKRPNLSSFQSESLENEYQSPAEFDDSN